MDSIAENSDFACRDVVSVMVRPDLLVETIHRGLHSVFVIKDPVTSKYFELEEHEFAILQQLTGPVDWRSLRDWFNRRFPPLRLSYAALESLVWRLYQQNLIVTSAAGQGRQIALREARFRRQALWQRFSSLWAIRLPGIHPGPSLAVANWLFGWAFNAWFVVCASCLMALLAILAMAHQRDFLEMAFQNRQALASQNLLLLTLVILVVKVLHESGHAVAAYRQGCECPEVGVMLLAGMPTMYCDVSDAWMLPSRGRRIAVSLAGIWVEFLISVLAFVVWLGSVPGLVHTISFQVMLVCSVGTLLFNANPLVRYDGYYVLMDLAGISNLGQRSHQAVVRLVERWVFGSHERPRLDEVELPWWCVWYGLASIVYRCCLMVAIVWGLHWALKPYSAGILLWTAVSAGFTAWGASMIRSSIQQQRRMRRMGTPAWRVGAGYLAIVGCILAATAIPVPWFVFGEATLEPADRQTLVATTAGKATQLAKAGDFVPAGSCVAMLENCDMQRDILQLEHDRISQERHVQVLEARRNHDGEAAEQIPAATASLAAIEHRIDVLRDEERRLKVKSVTAGRLFPAPPKFSSEEPGELPGWNGTPLDPVNRGVWFAAGEAVSQIGTTDQFDAIAILTEDDMDAVHIGQRADVFLVSTGTTIRGEVVRISRAKVEQPHLMPSMLDRNSKSSPPINGGPNLYQVEIRCLDRCPTNLRIRTRAKVRLHVGSRTLGDWLALQFFRTVRWRT